MIYILIACILLVAELIYFRVADHFNIIDKPNSRSSHSQITLRGGGIIVPFAAILYAIFFHSDPVYPVLGIVLISAISFWDDVKGLSNKPRLAVHLLSVSLLLFSMNIFQTTPVWLIIAIYILVIGAINAYNFMDGINGITGMYTLVNLLSFWYINTYVFTFTDEPFIILPAIAMLIFLFFNFRKKAKCFAGDVGSVGVGFWVITLLFELIVKSGNLSYILFLSVYGIDVILTIIHRLILRQNIFEAHRLHFYQILTNERKISHLKVAPAYALLQLAINVIVLSVHVDSAVIMAIICMPLVLVYMLLKPRLMYKTVY